MTGPSAIHLGTFTGRNHPDFKYPNPYSGGFLAAIVVVGILSAAILIGS